MPHPDIEIYLQALPASHIVSWLQQRFPAACSAARPAGKKQWQLRIQHQGHAIPVLIIEEASPGFTSLWFDSAHTPWPDDMACAREAFAHFACEIRATPGSWQEGDDPDRWWRIHGGGEDFVQWPT